MKIDVAGQDRPQQPQHESKGMADKAQRLQARRIGHDVQRIITRTRQQEQGILGVTARKKHVSQDRTIRAGQPTYSSESRTKKPGRQHQQGSLVQYSESRTIMNQDSPVRKAQAVQLRQDSLGRTA